MPVISMFYGVIVLMYYFDDRRHHLPHIHAQYAEEEVVLAIPSGEVLDGNATATCTSAASGSSFEDCSSGTLSVLRIAPMTRSAR